MYISNFPLSSSARHKTICPGALAQRPELAPLTSSLFTFHFSLFTFHFSLFTFHFSLFTLHSSLFTFHSPLFTKGLAQSPKKYYNTPYQPHTGGGTLLAALMLFLRGVGMAIGGFFMWIAFVVVPPWLCGWLICRHNAWWTPADRPARLHNAQERAAAARARAGVYRLEQLSARLAARALQPLYDKQVPPSASASSAPSTIS